MTNERTIINLRGYCFFCLKKICSGDDCSGSGSPACTPIAPSPLLSTPLRTRCHNVHNLPPEERLAPFTDLCRYLGVDVPDSYAFGDESSSEPEVLYPPLCDKCHDVSARLCILQDELQYIQTRIQNTVERIQRRVASTCDKRGAIKREEFNKEFRRKSKGNLSRGRNENPEVKKVTQLLKLFQIRIIEKDHENRERRKRRATNVLFSEMRMSLQPPLPEVNYTRQEPEASNVDDPCVMENEENVSPNTGNVHEIHNEEGIQSDGEDIFALTMQEYLPPEETLRCVRPLAIVDDNESVRQEQDFEALHVQAEHPDMVKPYPDISTILCPHQNDETRPPPENQIAENGKSESENDYDNDYHMKTTLVIGMTRRSQRACQSSLVSRPRPVSGRVNKNNYNLRRGRSKL